MPIWDIERNGRVVGEMESDHPPTREEVARALTALDRQSVLPRAERPREPPQSIAGHLGDVVSGAWEQVNPVAAVQGVNEALQHPIDTASGLLSAQGQLGEDARSAYQQGDYARAIRKGINWALPVIGPAIDVQAERMMQGEADKGVGGSLGLGLALAGPKGLDEVRQLRQTARAVERPGTSAVSPLRERVASTLQQGAEKRVAETMTPKGTGDKWRRMGTRAQKVAPNVVGDLVSEGAPWSRQGLGEMMSERLATAEAGLDAAQDVALTTRSVPTKPLIQALRAKLRPLTLEADVASQYPARRGPSGALVETPVGKNQVPAPSRARAAVIENAIQTLEGLGETTTYEELRKMRALYDEPAKVKYNPSVTADYLKQTAVANGAADVTGTLRSTLAELSPKTASANAVYHVYKSADDLMRVIEEVERTRPKVGRQIVARLTGMLVGAHEAGAAGAMLGYIAGPVIDTAVNAGVTSKLQTARVMQEMADAIRRGDVLRTTRLASKLRTATVANLATRGGRTLQPVVAEDTTSTP